MGQIIRKLIGCILVVVGLGTIGLCIYLAAAVQWKWLLLIPAEAGVSLLGFAIFSGKEVGRALEMVLSICMRIS